MGERPNPERKLEYADVLALYGKISAVFKEFRRHSDVQVRRISDAVELVKTVPDLPEGNTEWLSLYHEIYGTTHLYRISRIMQTEEMGESGLALQAGVTTYSFLALNRGSHTTIHSTRWGEEKELGFVAPVTEYGALLDIRMSPATIYDTSAAAPILQRDVADIEDMLADWR